MNFNFKSSSLLESWKQHSLRDKVNIVYIVALLILLASFPIINVWSLSSTDTTSFWLISGSMLRSSIMIVLVLLGLFARNISKWLQTLVSNKLWFHSNPLFINVLMLITVLISLFGIWDTLMLLQTQYSKIAPTAYLHIAQIAIVLGIIINTLGSLFQQKSRIPRTPGTQIDTTIDESEAAAFKKVEAEFSGLFGWDSADIVNHDNSNISETQESEQSKSVEKEVY